MLLLLHGARGGAQGMLGPLKALAEEAGIILLAPEARGRTWDVILSGFGADIIAIDEALDWTFERCAVDPKHVAIGGFSDGASYALSVGMANGDLFTHILAFSPDSWDEILPIDVSSRAFVPALKAAGYGIRYREFEGPHTVPDDIAREAIEWFKASPAAAGAMPPGPSRRQ